MVEGAGDSVKSLRRAMSQGLADPHRRPVGGNLAEVVIAAAILARQLGIDLNREIDTKLGSPTWQARARD